MISSAAVYQPLSEGSTTGSIVWISHGSRALLVQSGRPYIDLPLDVSLGVSARTHYVLNGEITPRAAMSATTSGLELAGLPDPCEIRSSAGELTTVTGGAVTLPAADTVVLHAFGFLDTKIDVPG